MATRRLSASSSGEHGNDNISPIEAADDNVFDDGYAASFDESRRSSRRFVQVSTPPSPTLQPESDATIRIPPRSSLSFSRHTEETISRPQQDSRTGTPKPSPTDQGAGSGRFSPVRSISPVSPQPRSAAMARRTLSAASEFSYARSQSPSQAGNGPSHPYGMYPQNFGVSRSASVATASTSHAPYPNNRSGPAHPYSLYPQSVSPEMAHDPVQIPVGFPGVGHTYRRRIGPEGEDQGLIGPDGHTEQLPPYTRYAEDAPTKTAVDVSLPVIGEGPFADVPSHGSPVSNSGTPLSAHHSTHSFANLPPRSMDTPRVEAATSQSEAPSEKSWSEKSWRERRQTRVCGMKIWILVVALFVMLVIIAVVCGAVIATYVGQTDKALDSKEDSSWPPIPSFAVYTYTELIDASAVASTAALPIPTGDFIVAFGAAKAEIDDCLSSHQVSWSCNGGLTPPNVDIHINSTSSGIAVSICTENENSSTLIYGSQRPSIIEQQLTVVEEADNSSLGQAYHFQMFYVKLVILPGNYIVPPAPAMVKRNEAAHIDWLLWRPLRQTESAGPGDPVSYDDQPWFCFWNQTFIEGFIFIESDPKMQSANATSYSATLDFASPADSSSGSASASASAISSSSDGYTPSATTTSSYYTSTTAGYTPATPTSAWSSWSTYQKNNPAYFPSLPYEAGWSTAVPSEGPTASSGGYRIKHRDYDIPNDVWGYPKYIKLEERRLPFDSSGTKPPPEAYCQQMMFGEDGTVVPYVLYGQPVVVPLTESDSSPYTSVSSSSTPTPTPSPSSSPTPQRRNLNDFKAPWLRERDFADGCYCSWDNVAPAATAF